MKSKFNYKMKSELIHNFACWASSRAIQLPGVKSGKSINLKYALEKSNIKEYYENPQHLSELDYKTVNNKLIEKIRKNLSWGENSYGIAAKLVAMYMKCAIILPNIHNKKLSNIIMLIYPPIDSESLKMLKKSEYKWTKLNREKYKEVISTLDKYCKENKITYLDFESGNTIIKK